MACGFESHHPHFRHLQQYIERLAQVVEHTTSNRKVIGSSPMFFSKGVSRIKRKKGELSMDIDDFIYVILENRNNR